MEKEWNTINKEIDKNASIRINYKALLGMSLTKYITLLKSMGYSSDMCRLRIINNPNIQIFINNCQPGWDQKIRQNIKIGVCARYAEQDQANKFK